MSPAIFDYGAALSFAGFFFLLGWVAKDLAVSRALERAGYRWRLDPPDAERVVKVNLGSRVVAEGIESTRRDRLARR